MLLILTAMIWGTAFVFQRTGMDSIEPITFNAARMLLAAVAVGMVSAVPTASEKHKLAGFSREQADAYRKDTVVGGICCGAFLAAASIFQQMGIVYTTAGKAGFITAMYMLLVPVIGFVFFRKRNSWIVWLSVLIGVFGMYLLCMTEGFRLTRGDTLVCICAVLPYSVLRPFCTARKSDPDLCDPVRVLYGHLSSSGADPGTAELRQGLVSGDPDPVLRDHFGRSRLYAADHCAEIYGSYDRVAFNEPGVSVCGDRRRSSSGRAHEPARAPGMHCHVHSDRARTAKGKVNESHMSIFMLKNDMDAKAAEMLRWNKQNPFSHKTE